MARVSVLLTCYNHLPYLRQAWTALLEQTYTDWDAIVLDDGSTDGTRAWLSELSDPRARVVLNETNLGTYGTLNRGLEMAQGEFVAVLNDDDLWLPRKLEAQVAMLDANPKIGLVHTDGEFIDAANRLIRGEPLGFPYPRTGTGDMFPALIEHNKIIASSACFRRSLVEETGPFDPGFYGSGDWHMWLRLAEVAHVGFVPESLTRYRVHGENACLDSSKMNRDDLRIREWVASRTEELRARWERDPALYAMVAHNWACLGTARAWEGDMAGARTAYRESLRFAPRRFKSRLRLLATYLPARWFRKLN